MLFTLLGSDDEDIEFYIRECGQILGITRQLPEESRTTKQILLHAVSHIMEYKKQNQVNNYSQYFINTMLRPCLIACTNNSFFTGSYI